jgi:hypothetical protein
VQVCDRLSDGLAQVVLVFACDPDLRLRFNSQEQYMTWVVGLTKLKEVRLGRYSA